MVQEEIGINAPAIKIWDTLTRPAKVKLYTGSNLETTWKRYDRTTWSGEMQGMPYVKKGSVLVVSPPFRLSYAYWSDMGGDADSPENYSTNPGISGAC